MRIDTGQHLRMDQRMKLAPRMIQSMEILQLPLAALEERIEQELAGNPTLELREPGADELDLRSEREQTQRDDREGEREIVVDDAPTLEHATNADDFERLDNLQREVGDVWTDDFETGRVGSRARSDDGQRDAKLDAMANTAARHASLAEQLQDQWRMLELPASVRAAGELLIDFIEEDGYLRTPLDKVITQAPRGMQMEHLQAALQVIQTELEPLGLGSADLRQCLLIQIDARIRAMEEGAFGPGALDTLEGHGVTREDLLLQRRILDEHREDLEQNRLPRIAKALGVDIERVKAVLSQLRHYHARPGSELTTHEMRSIIPDAVVTFDEEQDRYVAELTNERLPGLYISPRYQRMARDKAVDRKTREFVGNNLRNARWLIEAIEQRHSTLLRVIHVVLEAQRDFFDLGPQHLRPLPMTLVADQLGVHVATVSRAVSEKYLQTPRGILPLRMFFSGGAETQTGESMSWAAIQAKLQEIIQSEDKADPLSDDQLVEKLKQQGIDIARRTVAKYRKQLNIASARQRKAY